MGIILAPLLLFAPALLVAGDRRSETVTVFVLSGIRPPAQVVTTMQREAEAIVRLAGIELDWQHSLAGAAGRDYPSIVIVRLYGECRAEPPPLTAPRVPTSLGEAYVSEGQVMPFGDLHCDSVRALIAVALRTARPAEREPMLGRALGRVLAHELYHILGKTTEHGHDGVARSTHSEHDLTRPEFGLDLDDAQAISEACEDNSNH